MYSNLGVQRYRETDINTMSSEKMIVLLYERTVTDLKAAEKAIRENNRIEMTKHINHSQRIISELRGALDHSIGGEISKNLDDLYNFMFHEHLEILVDQDPAHIQNCLNVINPLLEAWSQIPTGTGEKAAQDRAKGNLNLSSENAAEGETGPETASNGQNTQGQANISAPAGEATLKKTSLLSVSA